MNTNIRSFYCTICFIKLFYLSSLTTTTLWTSPSKLIVASLGFLWLVSLVQAFVVVRVDSIPKSFSWITVRFDLTVFAFKIHIVEDNVAARDCVTTLEVDGFWAFRGSGYVPVHYLGYVNRRCLQRNRNQKIKFLSWGLLISQWLCERIKTWFWQVDGESQ